jgi:hypothetical protein
VGRSSTPDQPSEAGSISATVLPGVPLPAWARPAGPLVPEPLEEPAGSSAEVPDTAESLVLAAVVAAPDVPPAPAPPLPLPLPALEPQPAGLIDPDVAIPEDAVTEVTGVDAAPAGSAPAPAPLAPPSPTWGASFAAVAASSARGFESLSVPDDDADPSLAEQEAIDAAAPGDGSADTSRSRRTLVVVGAVGAAAVLSAVAAFAYPGFLVTQDPAPAPAPVAGAGAQVAPVMTLQAPASAAGMTKLAGPADAALSAAATRAALPGLSSPVTAVYGTGTQVRAEIVAWKAAAALPESSLATAFAGFQASSQASVTNIAPVASSPGQMSCGTSVLGAVPATVCFWADDASFGSVTVLRPATPAAAVATATALRMVVEKRAEN